MAKWRSMLRTGLYLLFNAGFDSKDLLMMMRGQVFRSRRDPGPEACQAGASDPQARLLPLLPHDVPQKDIPITKVPSAPRCRLMCPLHERSLAGESVLCGLAPRPAEAAADSTSPKARIAESFRAMGLNPCRLLHDAMAVHLPEFLGLPQDGPWPAGDTAVPLLRSLAISLLSSADDDEDEDVDKDDDDDEADEDKDEGGDGARVNVLDDGGRVAAHRSQTWLRFLLGTGRLSESEVREMVDHLVFRLADGWLPCDDDPQRDRLPVSTHSKKGPLVPAARYLCPLQVRGLRGDSTVPCVEALSLRPAASLLRKVREEYPEGALKRRRPPQPEYWTHPDQRPGGIADPVHELDLRPCEALGDVLIRGLVWLVNDSFLHHKEDMAELDRPLDLPA